ncbi:MAG: hypothetical protein ACREQB_00465 [Candidatus Binataceae bacterium]
MAPQRRAALVEHLGQCAKCDRAFRLFALGAPALQSDAPLDLSSVAHSPVSLSARRSRAAKNSAQRWLAMCAALALFVASGFAAYLSVAAPVGQLSDELTAAEGITEMLAREVPSLSNDLGG